jgi:hypothetical protein
MPGRPSPIDGLRLAFRLRKLVCAVWVVSIAAMVPTQLMIHLAAGEVRANLPAGRLPDGDAFLIFLELLRPVAVPVGVAVGLAVLTLFAWSVLWHGGTVRWWLGAGAAKVRLSEILGHGVVWWWRYARLWMIGNILTIGAAALVWMAVREIRWFAPSAGWEIILLALGLGLTLAIAAVGWMATLRGAWLLGESGRRSALVAWLRGLWAVILQPVRSTVPLLVWMVPAAVLLVLPVVLDMPWAVIAMTAGWLAGAFCWVALFVSFAPQEPPEEWVKKMQARAANRAAKPRDQKPNYSTERLPIQK